MTGLGDWLDTAGDAPTPPPATHDRLPRDDDGHWMPALYDMFGRLIVYEED